MGYKKKLIEVALPLDIINKAAAYDKMPGIGAHPKNLHYWWAGLPHPLARAILFASVVTDPAYDDNLSDRSLKYQNNERERLFGIIEKLCEKKIHENPRVYKEAFEEMLKHCDGKLPKVLDPFCGGGTIPLEAQRMGFESFGSDLNPVAVTISKMKSEIIPKYKNTKPINPNRLNMNINYDRATGLAEDVRYYGNKILEKMKSKLNDAYPRGKNGEKVLTYIWARTVISPNPFVEGRYVPLVKSFFLSTKGKEKVWIDLLVNKSNKTYTYKVNTGTEGPIIKTTMNSTGAICAFSDTPIPFSYIKDQGNKGLINHELMAVVIDNEGVGKSFSDPNDYLFDFDKLDRVVTMKPKEKLADHPQYMGAQRYGLKHYFELFNKRQLAALCVIKESIEEVQSEIEKDCYDSGYDDNQMSDYKATLKTLFSMCLNRLADYNNSLSIWKPSGVQQIHLFTRQAIPMVWDYCEGNIIGDKAICWNNAVKICASAIEVTTGYGKTPACIKQMDATKKTFDHEGLLISTDPPYYGNVPYSDISDFFYVWLKAILKNESPELFNTLLTPKNDELVADSHRFGGNEEAKTHFENGFKHAFIELKTKIDLRFPLTIFYAFKQTDVTKDKDLNEERSSTGWETMLSGLISSGFQITATWPTYAAQKYRMRARNSNAIASYIVLACRLRSENAVIASRREYINELGIEIEKSYLEMIDADLAPVDLQQALIGPGMAVFSKYRKILESDGSPMKVRTALQLINAQIDYIQDSSEIDMDQNTRFCVQWLESNGFEEKQYGEAESLALAKDISVNGLVDSGIFYASSGKAKLKHWSEMLADWDPRTDNRLTLWECTHHMIRELVDGDGQLGAAKLAKFMGPQKAEEAKELAYQLYHISDKRNWSMHAGDYNTLVSNWADIKSQIANVGDEQETLF